MFTTEIMNKAREIRKQAAQKYACTEKEIVWSLCVSMAFRKEKEIVMSETIKREMLKPDGRIYTVECKKKEHWNCGLRLVSYKVNGLSAYRKDDTLILQCPEDMRPRVNGKRLDGIKLNETKEDFFKFEDEAEKEYQEKQNSIQIQKYVVTDSTHYGITINTVPETNRKDIKETEKMLQENGTTTREALKGLEKESDMGDYSITDKYELTPEQFNAIIENVKKAEVERIKEEEEKAQALVEEKKKQTDEEIAKRYFTETIKVDEDGCFSKCDMFCDDCIDVRVWKKDVADEVRKLAETYTVNNKYGKTYFYKAVNEKSMQNFLSTQKQAIAKVRENFK